MGINDYLSIGGIKFRKDDILKHEYIKDSNNKSGFIVTLSTGAKVIGLNENASINKGMGASIIVKHNGEVNLNNVSLMIVEGADDGSDVFSITGKEAFGTSIYLDNDNYQDRVILEPGTSGYLDANDVYMGKYDVIGQRGLIKELPEYFHPKKMHPHPKSISPHREKVPGGNYKFWIK